MTFTVTIPPLLFWAVAIPAAIGGTTAACWYMQRAALRLSGLLFERKQP